MTKLLIALLVFSAAVATAQEGSYSYYNYFHNAPITDRYFTDGCHFGGPFRVNGTAIVTSSTPGRDNDPFFYSFTLSSDFFLYGTPSGPHVSLPHHDNLWIEPYELMEQGAPRFNLGVEPLPFGASQVEWQIVRSAAINYGLYLTSSEVPDGSRILLEDGQLTVKTSESSQPVVYSFSTLSEPVIWIENPATDIIYLKGDPDSQGFSEELIIGTQGDIYFTGPLEYNGETAGMLGLISIHGDGVIADKPNNDWDAPFDIETTESFVYSASILLLEGSLKAEDYTQPVPQVDFTLYGGIQMQEEGYTGTITSGFYLIYDYDERLLTENPPWYPLYEITSIEESNSLSFNLELTASANPFSTGVSLHVSEPANISIYDSSGRIVESADVDGELIWNSTSMPTGVFVVVATGDNGSMSTVRLIKL